MSDPIGNLEQRHREEVTQAYRASARLRLYSAWAAAFGVVLIVAVGGAMLIGWMPASDGFTWLSFAVLTALVSAAKFYADAARTTVSAAGLERNLTPGEDLHAGTSEYRRRLRRVGLTGVALALLATGTVTAYSIANANTRTSDDDDDDDDDTEQVDDDRSENDDKGTDNDDGDDGGGGDD